MRNMGLNSAIGVGMTELWPILVFAVGAYIIVVSLS